MKSGIGVIIGRFQVPALTDGHKALIRYVRGRHDIVMVLLGVAAQPFSKRDPLPFWMRHDMLLEFDDTLFVQPLSDSVSNDVWSDTVDRTLRGQFPGVGITLYCGRDSFAPHYTGHLPVHIFEQDVPSESGTQVRAEISGTLYSNYDIRLGAILAVQNSFTRVSPVIDVAILNHRRDAVLMGRKLIEEAPEGLRFIGGFVDPHDVNLERACRREAFEETTCEVDGFQYVGSFQIDDWRLRNSPERILSSFFAGTYIFGKPQGSDDLHSVQWVPIPEVVDRALPLHKPLAIALVDFLEKESHARASCLPVG